MEQPTISQKPPSNEIHYKRFQRWYLVQNNSGYISQPSAIGHTTSEKEIAPVYVPALAVTLNNLEAIALTDMPNNLQQETSKDNE